MEWLRPLMTASVMATIGQTLGQKHGVLDNVTMQERGSVRGARCSEEESPDTRPANSQQVLKILFYFKERV